MSSSSPLCRYCNVRINGSGDQLTQETVASVVILIDCCSWAGALLMDGIAVPLLMDGIAIP